MTKLTRKEIGKKAGQVTLQKYGKEHFSRMGKLGIKKQIQILNGIKMFCVVCGKSIIKDNFMRKYCDECSYKKYLERQRLSSKKYQMSRPEENKLRHKKYRIKHQLRIKERQKQIRHKNREEVINHFGKKCECCGENKKEFLCIDHINGGGRRHRREIGGDIYVWLIRNNYPKEYRILCYNCNMSLGFYGYCPHKK